MMRPQRFENITPPGDLLRRAVGIARVMPTGNAKEPSYLNAIRQLPCLQCGLEPCGEAAHVRFQSGTFGKHGGIGKKPADRWAVSLCRPCHMQQHHQGETEFWNGLGINPLLVASNLYAAKGDVVRMRAIVLVAIASRT